MRSFPGRRRHRRPIREEAAAHLLGRLIIRRALGLCQQVTLSACNTRASWSIDGALIPDALARDASRTPTDDEPLFNLLPNDVLTSVNYVVAMPSRALLFLIFIRRAYKIVSTSGHTTPIGLVSPLLEIKTGDGEERNLNRREKYLEARKGKSQSGKAPLGGAGRLPESTQMHAEIELCRRAAIEPQLAFRKTPRAGGRYHRRAGAGDGAMFVTATVEAFVCVLFVRESGRAEDGQKRLLLLHNVDGQKKKISLMQSRPPRAAFAEEAKPARRGAERPSGAAGPPPSAAPAAARHAPAFGVMLQRAAPSAPRARLDSQLECYQPRYHTIREREPPLDTLRARATAKRPHQGRADAVAPPRQQQRTANNQLPPIAPHARKKKELGTSQRIHPSGYTRIRGAVPAIALIILLRALLW
ncbi:hypothetical protein EVAR_64540_1 [Eumeta japonica]|uniref:Uncharacterized protein n=1 Tax=Eumeta variegata TaxID=151549 RepID=A0A4C1ZV79_EUMVA|nr:hypothetical protein EVAR_64540_1 [Eumeta japonica]